MWKNVEEISGQHNIINTGFGGSTAKDLLGYTDPLILDHNPDQVFIYEGDNDIFMEESLRSYHEKNASNCAQNQEGQSGLPNCLDISQTEYRTLVPSRNNTKN